MNAADAANAAMAEIERNLAGTFEAPTSRLHERPRILTHPGEPQGAISPPPQTLPAMLAEMQAIYDSGLIRINDRLARIEAFLGIDHE